MVEDGQWGNDDGDRLRKARLAREHTQEECAQALRDEGARATQSTVYSWEKARTGPASATLPKVRAYMEEPFSPPVHGGRRHPKRRRPAAVEIAPSGTTSADDGGSETTPLTNPLTGERELSVRQAAWLDQVIAGAASVSPDGADLFRWAGRVLGLGQYQDPPGEGTREPSTSPRR